MKTLVKTLISIIATIVFIFAKVALGQIDLPPPGSVGIATENVKTEKLRVSEVLPPKFPHPLSSYPLRYQCQQCGIDQLLPGAYTSHRIPGTLTLRDAILLALRNNPDVENSELTRIVDKYNVIVARYAFEPQFTLGGSATYFRNGVPNFEVNSSVNLFTPIGSTINFAYTNPFGGSNGNATLTFTQPLLRGFGFVNRIPYLDALDNEEIAKITFRTQIINVVVAVETSYRALVEDYNNLEIQKQNYHETLEQLKQYRLMAKVGKMSPSDLNQQEANLANAKLGVIQQQDQVQDDYQTFLSSLGLIPSAIVSIDKHIDLDDIHLPTLKESIRLALAYNTDFQTALIQLRSTKRAIIVARDARKPQLNVTYTQPISFNDSSFGGTNGMVPINGGGGNGFTLNLQLDIPINDVPAKANLIGAEVALEQAQLSLEQQKEDLIRQVMTSYRSLQIQWQGILIAETSVKLQEQTLKDAQIKLKYGKITMFEVIQDQVNLLQARTDLVSQKIQYLNSVTTFYQNLGITLDVWDIKLRY